MREITIKFRKGKIKAHYAETFFEKARGLMFAVPPKNKGLLIDCNKESRLGSSIHMLFVFFPLDILWLNSKKKIVDIRHVFSFMPFAMSRKPTKYVLELPSGYGKKFKIGEKLRF